MMTPANEIAQLDVVELATAMDRDALTSAEATAACLSLLANDGVRLGCVARIEAPQAIEQAERADVLRKQGKTASALHGVPLAHKDMFFRKGWLTECGSSILRGHRTTTTASVLKRLDSAGAIDLGRLAMSEFAIGPTGHNTIMGTPRNPWNEAHLAGGTSSGAAVAVAARLIPAALASDTGGSARLPAAFCGIVGLKPSYGRVSRYGMFPVSATLDHVGILARTVMDSALLLAAVSGHDARDPASSPRNPKPIDDTIASGIAGLLIGVPREYFFDDLDSELARRMEDSLEVLRSEAARLVPIDIPDAALGNPLASLITMVEAATVHRRWLTERPQDYAPETLARLATGNLYTAVDYRLALTARAHLLQKIGESALARADILFTPAATMTAPRIDGAELPAGTGFAELVGPMGRCLRLFNVSGLPAIVLPAGRMPNGLPVAVQLVGRPFGESTLLRAAFAFERAVGGFPAPPRSPQGNSGGDTQWHDAK